MGGSSCPMGCVGAWRRLLLCTLLQSLLLSHGGVAWRVAPFPEGFEAEHGAVLLAGLGQQYGTYGPAIDLNYQDGSEGAADAAPAGRHYGSRQLRAASSRRHQAVRRVVVAPQRAAAGGSVDEEEQQQQQQQPTAADAGASRTRPRPSSAQAALLSSLPGADAPKPATPTSVWGMACTTDQVLMPATTDQLAAALQQLDASNLTYTVRATHSGFHTSSSMACTTLRGGGDGAVRVVVLIDRMASTLATDLDRRRIKVQAGMSLGGLLRAADDSQLSVPLLTLPDFVDLTVGGVLATGATGTGLGTNSNLADIVVDLTWVNARGQVFTSSRDSPEGHALIAGVGLIGIITEVTLQLDPWSVVRVDTPRLRASDKTLADDINNFLKVQEKTHLTVIWRPDMGVYTAFTFTLVPPDTRINGTLNDTPLSEVDAALLRATLRTWQSDVAGSNNAANAAMCGVVGPMASVGKLWARSLASPPRPVEVAVGSVNDMMTGGCSNKPCPWDADGADFAIYEAHSAIELEQLPAWMDDVRALTEQDLRRAGSALSPACLPPGFVWLRFGQATQDTFSWYGGLKEPVHIQLSLFSSREALANGRPMRHPFFMEAVEQLNLCKYKARPHWGKNFDRTFTHPSCPLAKLYDGSNGIGGIPAMQQLQAVHDPRGAFVSPLMRRVLTGAAAVPSPGCALRGECYCSANAHCARGYSCVSSSAFPAYKVCKPSGLAG